MRVHYTIYDPATGRIIRSGACAERDVELQYDPDTEALLREKSDPQREKVEGGSIQSIPRSEADIKKEALDKVRQKRDKLLLATDWTQLSDAPLSAADKAKWAAYRNELRAVPESADKEDFVWPTPPEKRQGRDIQVPAPEEPARGR